MAPEQSDLPEQSESEDDDSLLLGLPDIDDPNNLVLRILAIEAAPISERDGAPSVPIVHYTWNLGLPKLFDEDCTVSDDAEAAIKASGYSSWPLESLKEVFRVPLTKSFDGPDRKVLFIGDKKYLSIGDEHVYAVISSEPCPDHDTATRGSCQTLRLASQPVT